MPLNKGKSLKITIYLHCLTSPKMGPIQWPPVNRCEKNVFSPAWVIPCLVERQATIFCFAQSFFAGVTTENKYIHDIVYIYIHTYTYFAFVFVYSCNLTTNVILPPKNGSTLPASGVMGCDVLMAWRYLDQFLEISIKFLQSFCYDFPPDLQAPHLVWGAGFGHENFSSQKPSKAANHCQRAEPVAGWDISYFTLLNFEFIFWGSILYNHCLKRGDVTWRRIIIVHIKSHVELKCCTESVLNLIVNPTIYRLLICITRFQTVTNH